jgi:hypothetical protein
MKAPESDREALYLQIKTAGLSIVPAAASVAASVAASCPAPPAASTAQSKPAAYWADAGNRSRRRATTRARGSVTSDLRSIPAERREAVGLRTGIEGRNAVPVQMWEG